MTELEDGGAPGRRDAGPGSEPEDGIDRARAWLVGTGLGALALAAMVVAFVIGTNYSDEPAVPVTAAGEDVPALPQEASGPGKDLFTANCGACHTLSEAGTSGTAGPDLDSLAPDEEIVAQAIAKGGTGTGMMPPGLLTGKEAEQVSTYVSAAAGGD